MHLKKNSSWPIWSQRRWHSEENTGIQVYIGDETPVQTMKDCSVVTATYELGDGMKGTIGIIGPKRMDYEHVMDAEDPAK